MYVMMKIILFSVRQEKIRWIEPGCNDLRNLSLWTLMGGFLLLLQSNHSFQIISSQPRLHYNHFKSRLAPQIKITPMSDLESDTDSAGGPCPHQPGMNFLR